jgi:hypothetical protein
MTFTPSRKRTGLTESPRSLRALSTALARLFFQSRAGPLVTVQLREDDRRKDKNSLGHLHDLTPIDVAKKSVVQQYVGVDESVDLHASKILLRGAWNLPLDGFHQCQSGCPSFLPLQNFSSGPLSFSGAESRCRAWVFPSVEYRIRG